MFEDCYNKGKLSERDFSVHTFKYSYIVNTVQSSRGLGGMGERCTVQRARPKAGFELAMS